jgi:hypothetical protein
MPVRCLFDREAASRSLIWCGQASNPRLKTFISEAAFAEAITRINTM